MSQMKHILGCLAVMFCLAAFVSAEQAALTIQSPDQGSAWKLGDEIPVKIFFGNTDTIKYSDIEIDLLDAEMDPFDYPKNVIEFVCSFDPKNAPNTCPPIDKDGYITFSFPLRPVVQGFKGRTTFFVKSTWSGTGGDIIDSLTQTLTILVVEATSTPAPPTPTKKFARTKIPGTPSKKPTATPSKKPTATPGKATPTPGKATPSKKPSPPVSVTKKFASTRTPAFLRCILTQIGSGEYSCPLESNTQCCGGFCVPVPDDGNTDTCCNSNFSGSPYFCAKGLNCCDSGCCVNKKKIPL